MDKLFTSDPCSDPANSSEYRLIRRNSHAGLVVVMHQETSVWDTVCEDALGTDEKKAVCQILPIGMQLFGNLLVKCLL